MSRNKTILIAALTILAVLVGAYLAVQFLIPETPSHETQIAATSEELTVSLSSMGTVHDAEMEHGSSRVVSYLWDFGDGSTSNERNPTHAYATPGTYAVTLTIAREDGIRFTDTKQVVVG